MKTILSLILTAFLLQNSFSQKSDGGKTAGDSAARPFSWDIRKADRGTLMFLDVPFQREKTEAMEYLTLTVAKEKGKLRPAFISIIIPNNIVQSNGIFIKFARDILKDGRRSMELDKGDPTRLEFENCGDSTCTARIIDGYATNENGDQEDVFQEFLTLDHVFFLFLCPDGTHKTVAVPLFSFKEQYKGLED